MSVTIELLLLCMRVLLAIVFVSAGAAKLLDPAGSRKAASDFGLPHLLAKPIALLLPIVELLTAVLLVWTSVALWGAAVGFGLLLVFAVVITITLLSGRTPECHCFGQFYSRPISWALVARDAALAIGAAAILREGPGMQLPTAIRRFTEIAAAQPLPLAAASLAVTGFFVQTLLLVGLLRQRGRLILRLDKLEQTADWSKPFTPPPPAAAGLPAGVAAPSFNLSSERGKLSLETLLICGKPVLLLFTDPNCHPCLELLPDIARWERQYADMLTFVIVSRASASASEQFRTTYAFQHVVWQENREISELYKVGGTPSAVVVRPDGRIGTWLAAGRPAIQTLLTFLLQTRMLMGTEQLVG